jgi:hypothetical protein
VTDAAPAFDQPKSSPEAEFRLLKKIHLNENTASYLKPCGGIKDWPVLFAISLIFPWRGKLGVNAGYVNHRQTASEETVLCRPTAASDTPLWFPSGLGCRSVIPP